MTNSDHFTGRNHVPIHGYRGKRRDGNHSTSATTLAVSQSSSSSSSSTVSHSNATMSRAMQLAREHEEEIRRDERRRMAERLALFFGSHNRWEAVLSGGDERLMTMSRMSTNTTTHGTTMANQGTSRDRSSFEPMPQRYEGTHRAEKMASLAEPRPPLPRKRDPTPTELRRMDEAATVKRARASSPILPSDGSFQPVTRPEAPPAPPLIRRESRNRQILEGTYKERKESDNFSLGHGSGDSSSGSSSYGWMEDIQEELSQRSPTSREEGRSDRTSRQNTGTSPERKRTRKDNDPQDAPVSSKRIRKQTEKAVSLVQPQDEATHHVVDLTSTESDALAASPEKVTKRGPGRPRKNSSFGNSSPKTISEKTTKKTRNPSATTPKRGPGRPRKSTTDPKATTPKRGPGRPRKSPVDPKPTTPKRKSPGRPRKSPADPKSTTPKRGPGRPRKNPIVEKPDTVATGSPETAKRPRLRPRKYLIDSVDTATMAADDASVSSTKKTLPDDTKGMHPENDMAPQHDGAGVVHGDDSVEKCVANSDEAAAKRGRGRPKGSSNRAKAALKQIATEGVDDKHLFSKADITMTKADTMSLTRRKTTITKRVSFSSDQKHKQRNQKRLRIADGAIDAQLQIQASRNDSETGNRQYDSARQHKINHGLTYGNGVAENGAAESDNGKCSKELVEAVRARWEQYNSERVDTDINVPTKNGGNEADMKDARIPASASEAGEHQKSFPNPGQIRRTTQASPGPASSPDSPRKRKYRNVKE